MAHKTRREVLDQVQRDAIARVPGNAAEERAFESYVNTWEREGQGTTVADIERARVVWLKHRAKAPSKRTAKPAKCNSPARGATFALTMAVPLPRRGATRGKARARAQDAPSQGTLFHPLGPPILSNPRPPEWGPKTPVPGRAYPERLEPNAFYPCKPYEAAWLGRDVPRGGRSPGGRVVGCATPSATHPTQGQLVIAEKGGGKHLLRRNLAKMHLRPKYAVARPAPDEVAQAVEYSRTRDYGTTLPVPTGLEYPHRADASASVCSVQNPLWAKLESIAEKTSAKVEREHPGLSDQEHTAKVFATLAENDTYQRAMVAERRCGLDYGARSQRKHEARSRGGAHEGQESTLAWQRAYRARGGDTTDTVYIDSFAEPSARARLYRKAGRLADARKAEGEARALRGSRRTRKAS